MSQFKMQHLSLAFGILSLLVLTVVGEENQTKHSPQISACRLLNEKFQLTNPWASNPIVFEPIVRGRLTIWSGMSTLTNSEFKCLPTDDTNANQTTQIQLKFANYANQLEFSFYDSLKRATYMGIAVDHRVNNRFKVTIKNRQLESYLECNVIEEIEFLDHAEPLSIQISCAECNQSVLALIESQIKELFKSKFNEQIVDNLYWQLTQLLSNQHFSSPMPLENNLD